MAVDRTKGGRKARFFVNGAPKWIRIYDNGGPEMPNGTCDRYTVVYTGRYKGRPLGKCEYLGMSGAPFHPQGIGQHGEADGCIDRPAYSHLGKKIKWDDLPKDCQTAVLQDYKENWRY